MIGGCAIILGTFSGLFPDFWAIPEFLGIIFWLFPDFWVSFIGKI